jgi:nucleotidyltransferase substrate binding protein (TIGR01987 family)
MQMLDLTSLDKAVSALERTIRFIADRKTALAGMQKEEREIYTSAVVQHFEFTYELCWKFMRRWLEGNLSPGSTPGLTRKQLFRLAAEERLIADVEAWFRYHELRNLTSHTYDSEVAAEIYVAATPFALAARELLTSLEARND